MLPMTGIDEFLTYLQAEKRYAQHTIKAYKNDLNQFHAFCQENGSENMDLHHKTIRSWVVSLMDKGSSSRTVHRKLTSLRTYCKYLIRQGSLDANPLDKVLKPKLSKRVPSFVDEEKMNQLLDQHAFGEDFSGTRNKLIIELLYQTGIRRSELVGLRLDSVDLHGETLKVLGKRSRERIMPMSSELAEEISVYISFRSKLADHELQEALFLTERGNPIYDQLVYRVVNKYLALVSTLEKKSPHILRHTFATHMLNKGAALNAIKELLGHTNLSATQIYTHNTFKKLKSIYNQAHPRA